MLNANVIEFGGEVAVINSYSDHPALVENMNRQREQWAANCPNATVETRRMSESEIIALVAAGRAKGDHLYNHAHAIAEASKA